MPSGDGNYPTGHELDPPATHEGSTDSRASLGGGLDVEQREHDDALAGFLQARSDADPRGVLGRSGPIDRAPTAEEVAAGALPVTERPSGGEELAETPPVADDEDSTAETPQEAPKLTRKRRSSKVTQPTDNTEAPAAAEVNTGDTPVDTDAPVYDETGKRVDVDDESDADREPAAYTGVKHDDVSK